MARRRSGSSRRSGSPRALALGIVLFLLALMLAPPTQRYFAQRAQISAVRAHVNANNQALADAARELTLWKDPNYVKSQARSRLHFVMPGERQYIVTDPATGTTKQTTAAVAKDIASGLPWYNRLIASITETGSA